MTTDAVINPVSGKKSPKLGPVAVMSATGSDIQYLCDALRISKGSRQNFLVTDLWISDDNISVAGPFTGAPHAAMVLENLIVCGVEKIIFTGWCGAVSPDIHTGDIIIAEGAYSDEGTSRHYDCPDRDTYLSSSESLTTVLKKSLTKKELGFHSGTIWTTDAIYRETPDKIKHYQKMGVLGVEMELSALIAVSRFRQVEIASLQVVSDEVASMIWKPGFGNKRFKKSRRAVAEIVADASMELIDAKS